MKRALVFIDGNNFYFRLKDILGENKSHLLNFDFLEFSKELVYPNTFVGSRYYIGALKRQKGNEKSEKMYANQQKLFAKLHKQDIPVILGNLIQHPDKTFHEKGVDIRIAVELIRLAREDVYDIAYVVSSDTDFVAAFEEVRFFGKEICYVGGPKSQSFGLTKASNETKLLRFKDIENFLNK